MRDNKFGRYLTAGIVLSGIVGTYFFSRPGNIKLKTKLGDKQQKKIDRNLLTPANATFGIVWSTIYVGTIALAIHQALPSQLDNPRYKKAQLWLRLNYILTGLFGYFFSKSDKISRVGAAVTTISMLPAAIGLHGALEIGQTDVDATENIIQKSVSLYTGWLTAASAISATTLVQEMGYFKKTDDAAKFTLIALPVLSGIGKIVSKRLNDPYYMLALIAALAGIAVKQKDNQNEVSALAASLAVALLAETGNRLRLQHDII